MVDAVPAEKVEPGVMVPHANKRFLCLALIIGIAISDPVLPYEGTFTTKRSSKG